MRGLRYKIEPSTEGTYGGTVPTSCPFVAWLTDKIQGIVLHILSRHGCVSNQWTTDCTYKTFTPGQKV